MNNFTENIITENYLEKSYELKVEAMMMFGESFYYELKHHIENERSHIIDTSKHPNNVRGVGKTYQLVRLSYEYNIPILCFSEINEYKLRSESIEQGFNPDELLLYTLKDYSMDKEVDYLLIDENSRCDLFALKKLVVKKAIIGFD